MYIAVKLGPYYFGIWAFINLLIAVFSNINFGIANAINILLVQNKDNKSKCDSYIFNAFILVFVISLLPLGVLFYDRLFTIEYFAKYHLGNLIFIVALIIIVGHINTLFSNIFRVKNKIFEIAFNQSVLSVLIFILMFFASNRTLLILLTVAYLVANLLSLYLYYRAKTVVTKGSFDKSLSKNLLTKSLFLFIYNSCFYFIILSTKTLISYNYTVKEFGYFAFAFTIANASILLLDSFMFLIFPKTIDILKGTNLLQIKTKIDFFRNNYITTIQSIIYLAMPFCFVFIHFFEQYKNSYFSLILIMLTLMLYSNSAGYVNYLLANNYEKKIAFFAMTALIINIISVLALIKIFKVGFEYCILGTMITYFVYTAVIIIFSLKTLKITAFYETIKEIIPLNIFIPFSVALLLGLTNNINIIWLPLAVYITLNFNKIIDIFKTLKKLILNPDIINVE